MENPSVTIQKMLLQSTLIANLDTLSVYFPDLFNIFKEYSPETSGVVLDDEGVVNLFHNGNTLYNNAKEMSLEQVKQFIEQPKMFVFDLQHQPDEHLIFEHSKLLKKIKNKRLTEVKETLNKPIDEEQLDFICMIGAGLGYQVEALFQQKQIVNFLLCEPSNDIFYAMLHCIELKPIIEHCCNVGGSFSLQVGGSSADIINEVSSILHQHGHFNFSRMFVYQHYQSEINDETLKLFRQLAHRWITGWGFMEDEMISIEHTLENLQRGYKVCKNNKYFENAIANKPVFIVANGPSVDFSMAFLQKNANDIIIVSCGTALKALLKNNIKPDIHIEMERTKQMLYYAELTEKQQKDQVVQLGDIQLIALNTVYGELLDKYKNPLLLTKSHDGGGGLIKKMDELAIHATPFYSNPTVTNTALAVVISLGFEQLYLIGTDFGYISGEHHHSKDSIYHTEEWGGNKLDENRRIKGNLVEEVFTSEVFDASRANIELLLELHSNVMAYNCSNGAYINRAEPLELSNITPFQSFESKDKLLKELLWDAFDNNQFTDDHLVKVMESSLKDVKSILDQLFSLLHSSIESRADLSKVFSLQNKLLFKLKEQEKYQVVYLLVKGSFNYFQSYIMTNCYYYDDLVLRRAFIDFSLDEFKKHIDDLYLKFAGLYDNFINVD